MGKNIGFISLVLVLVLTTTCKKVDLSASKNLEAGRILVFGHGGSGFPTEKNPYPPNSASSVFRAIDFLGADGVEIDVQLSSDSVLILYHDEDLRTQTACKGCIAETSISGLANCDYRRYYHFKSNGEGIATLKDILERFKQYQTHPLVSVNVHLHYDCLPDVQLETYVHTFARSIVKLIKDYTAYDWVFVESGTPDFLNILRALDSQLKLYYDAPVTPFTVDQCLNNNWQGLISPLDEASKEHIELAHDKKLKVAVYNVKLRNEIKQAIEVNPDFIQSDNVQLLKQYLNE